MRQLYPIRALRGLLVAIGLIAAVLATITYHAPGAHAPADLALPEFGANLRPWVGLCVVATVALAGAIFLSRGLIRWVLCLLLLFVWWSDVEPARQYYAYVHAGRSH
jgi:hypothetical protein